MELIGEACQTAIMRTSRLTRLDNQVSMHTRQIASDAVTDSVFALRSFRRSPGWTFVTLLTIALGVGASTAVFSVADTFLIRPLAYRDASRVYAVSLQGRLQAKETISLPMSAAIVREWRNSARTIEAAAAYGGGPSALLRGDPADVSVATALVDASFLAFTGARPLIGRNFTADETVPNGPRAIMLAEGFWRRQFGASPGVLGKAVRLDLGGDPDSRPGTIVGVMPASVVLPNFTFERPDVWLPLIGGERAKVRGVAVRLKPGVSPKAASEDLTAIFDRAGGIDPADRPLEPRIRLSRPQDDLPFRQALLLLTGAVIFLLLIACTNVSHLLLERGLARERELATRHALGAHRGRLVRQLVTESTLLALAGGALAIFVGWGGLEVLAHLRPASLPALSHLTTTRGVIPLAAGLAIAVGLTVGVLGALHVAHERLGLSLRTGASSASPAHRRLRGTLVIGQVALSTILLAGALLLIRVVFDLNRVRLGFDPYDLYAVSFGARDLNAPQSADSVAAFAAMIRDMGERQFGPRTVTIAATATTGMAFASAFESRARPGATGSSGITGLNYVAPDYFSIMRMPLIAGRTFDEGSLSRNEVIVSRSLAQQLGYGGNVVGREFRFRVTRDGVVEPWQTVVGVAPDILANRLDRKPQPMLFRPAPGGGAGTTLVVRLPRKDAGDVLRRFASSVQPDPLTWRVRNVDEQVEQSMAEPRFTMAVLVVFATCGVLLAAIGFFGVLSYSLGLRTREIGVRITLGATRRHIAGLFVRDAMGQAALGTGIGLAGALGVQRLTQMSFYGVESLGTSTFILAAASMLVASLAACAGPLFRATRVDPAVAIRAE
jgi:putative ABC transport system permease protein